MLFYKNSRKKVYDYDMDQEKESSYNSVKKYDLIYCEPSRKEHTDGYCYIIDIDEDTGKLICKDRLGAKRKLNIKKDEKSIKFIRHGVYYGPLSKDSFNRLRKFGNTVIAYDTFCYYNCDVNAIVEEFKYFGFDVTVKVYDSNHSNDCSKMNHWLSNDGMDDPSIIVTINDTTLHKSHDKHIL